MCLVKTFKKKPKKKTMIAIRLDVFLICLCFVSAETKALMSIVWVTGLENNSVEREIKIRKKTKCPPPRHTQHTLLSFVTFASDILLHPPSKLLL